MEVARRKERDAIVLDIVGDVSLLNARELRKALQQAIAEPAAVVVANLKQVPYIDSSGIGCLIAAYSELRKGQRVLALLHVPETVQRTLEITNVIGFFPICSSMEEVFAAIQR